MPIRNRSIPSINSLITFEAAARLGTFTRASNELCVTPTAVSKQIKLLEAFLNTDLFLRKKAGLELTEKGQSYLKIVTQVLNTLAESSECMNDDANVVDISIEVGVCFSHFWLIPRLDDFREKHPDIRLSISTYTENRRTTESELLSKPDVSFYYEAVNDNKEQGSVQLFKERIMLVCSPSFLEKHPDATDLSQLWQQPLLGLRNSPDFWESWETWANVFGIAYSPPRNELRMEDQIAVLHAAMGGAGIALAWDWHVDSLLETGQLITLTEPVEFHNNAYFLTRSTSPAKQRNIDCFFDWVVGTASST